VFTVLILAVLLLAVSAPGAAQVPTWTVDPQPLLRLGTGDLPGHDLFRVRGAVRLGDGTIVVADGSSRELRFFDSVGGLVRVLGGRGGGPGEFEEMGIGLGRMGGDTLVVVDRALRRVTRFSAAGTVVDSRLLPDSEFRFRPSYLVEPNGVVVGLASDHEEPRRGVFRVTGLVVIIDPVTLRVDTVSRFEGVENARARSGDRWVTILRPYGRDLLWAHGGKDTFFVGDSGDRSISVLTRGTSGFVTTGRIEVPDRPRPVTAAHRAAWLEGVGSTPSGARTLRDFGDIPFPRQLPVFRSLRSDEAGLLWVQAYPELGQTNAKWWVFEPSGEMVGLLESPPPGRILEIGEDYLLTLRSAEDGTEIVELHRLRRAARR
jgi:hypothetical protein